MTISSWTSGQKDSDLDLALAPDLVDGGVGGGVVIHGALELSKVKSTSQLGH
jgi:hypothetical protein